MGIFSHKETFIPNLWHMMAWTQLVVQVRPSSFCKQCFIHLYLDVSSWELSIPIRQLFAQGSLFYFRPVRSHITHQVSQWGCWSRAVHALADSTQPLSFNSLSCIWFLQRILFTSAFFSFVYYSNLLFSRSSTVTTSDVYGYGIFDSWILRTCEDYELLSSQSCPLNNLENIVKFIVSLA